MKGPRPFRRKASDTLRILKLLCHTHGAIAGLRCPTAASKVSSADLALLLHPATLPGWSLKIDDERGRGGLAVRMPPRRRKSQPDGMEEDTNRAPPRKSPRSNTTSKALRTAEQDASAASSRKVSDPGIRKGEHVFEGVMHVVGGGGTEPGSRVRYQVADDLKHALSDVRV
eukprot:300611-Rhodomonas_salina.2